MTTILAYSVTEYVVSWTAVIVVLFWLIAFLRDASRKARAALDRTSRVEHDVNVYVHRAEEEQ